MTEAKTEMDRRPHRRRFVSVSLRDTEGREATAREKQRGLLDSRGACG